MYIEEDKIINIFSELVRVNKWLIQNIYSI